MKSNSKIRIATMAIILTLACGTADAQRLHRHHHPHALITVVEKPSITVHLKNELNQKERFAIAVAYLKENKYITVNKYAKMTGLTKATAKAELDSFAADKNRPISAVTKGKKRVYVINNK